MSRKYSIVDLIRFNTFANEKKNKKKSKLDLIMEYNKKFPELSAKEQLINLFDALKIKHNLKRDTAVAVTPKRKN